MVIREVDAAEAATVADLIEVSYREVLGARLSDGYLESLRDVARRAEETVVLVAVDNDGWLTGTVTYTNGPSSFNEFPEPGVAGIRMLAVVPWAQGRGVGRALVEACIARASAEGCHRIALHTVSVMTVAQRMYEAIGFRRVPEREHVLPSGTVLLAYEIDVEPALQAAPIVGSGRVGHPGGVAQSAEAGCLNHLQ